jgi:hypothetical protein
MTVTFCGASDVSVMGDPKRKNKESIGTETGAWHLSRLSIKNMEDSHSPAIL